MKLSNRYNIPQETINKMIKDGVLSSKWPSYEEIYTLYLSMISSGKSKEQLYQDIGEAKNIPSRTVKEMIRTMDKI